MQAVTPGTGSARRGPTPAPAWSAPAARDRLSSTAVLAFLFHGLVILGISFGSSGAGHDEGLHEMEVVVVLGEHEDPEAAATAVLLAQKNRTGTGNAAADASLQTAAGAGAVAGEIAPPAPGGLRDRREADFGGFHDPATVLMADQASTTAPVQAGSTQPMESVASRPPGERAPDVLGRLGESTRIPDARPDDLLAGANTRESKTAAYLNVWKRKVEQVGSMNFPSSVHPAGAAGHPVLEVAINADGSLHDVIVRSSSGLRGLDRAAMDILRMASPFEPFPDALRAEHEVLRFAYEWRFSEAGTTTARVSTR